jgi:hypothetical protein
LKPELKPIAERNKKIKRIGRYNRMPPEGVEPRFPDQVIEQNHFGGVATVAHDGFIYFLPLTSIWCGSTREPNPGPDARREFTYAS